MRSVNCCRLTLVEAAPELHPFAEKFPALSPDDYDALKASIKAYGQFEPIVINASGQILDGRHRHRACIELGITPKTVSFETIKNATSVQYLSEARYVYDSNIARRNLTPSQKAALALEFLPLARKECDERRRNAQAKGRATRWHSNGNAPHAEPAKHLRGLTTNQVLADRAGVGAATMAQVVSVHDHAPELLPAITNGSLSAAKAAEMIPAKPKQAASVTPGFKETVLGQWKPIWADFLSGFQPRERKKVRAIIVEHLSRA